MDDQLGIAAGLLRAQVHIACQRQHKSRDDAHHPQPVSPCLLHQAGYQAVRVSREGVVIQAEGAR